MARQEQQEAHGSPELHGAIRSSIAFTGPQSVDVLKRAWKQALDLQSAGQIYPHISFRY